MSSRGGFTEAEMAAFEWSRSRGHGRRRNDYRSHRRDEDSRGRNHSAYRRDHHEYPSHRRHADSRHKSPEDCSNSGSSKSPSPKSHRYDSSDSDTPADPFNPLEMAHARHLHRSKARKSSKVRNLAEDQEADAISDKDRWDHDLYESDGERARAEERYNKQKRGEQVPGIYIDTREGSWISRAGGVYIPPSGSTSDLYSDAKPKRALQKRRSRSRSYERADPVYTLD
ncbi:hypothetical protein BdWA1_000601 [Babesia duncani]|uniref:Uncharacterized protein n=1 Tax=Babesia duncani TaxID=323732 RepID=A0AAD9PMR1_9APIC|nr:hypothetical protein BdWA1_000601 [Babesia duncani]